MRLVYMTLKMMSFGPKGAQIRIGDLLDPYLGVVHVNACQDVK